MGKAKIYIKCLIFTIFFIGFFSSISLGACQTSNPSACKNVAGGTGGTYDNQTSVEGNSLIYLKMFGLDNLSCSGTSDITAATNRVKAIQNSMATNCGYTGCIDGFFGNNSQVALGNCATIYCQGRGEGYVIPTLAGDTLSCSNGYELDDKCCKPNTCTRPLTGGACDYYGSGYKPNSSGTCCIFDCQEGRECPAGKSRNTGSCSCKCDPNKGCCGVQLNIPMPFIGDCIEMTTSNDINGTGEKLTVNQLNAFPVLIKGISKIIVTLIMVFSIIVVIVAGVMMTTSVANESNYKTGMNMLQKVIISLILLGTSGLILKLINPSFFGG